MHTISKIIALLLFVNILYANSVESSIKKLEDNFCKQLPNAKKFCMEYKVEYPVVYSQDENLARNINRAIQRLIPTLNAKKYIAEYLKETNGEVFSTGHSDETKITLLAVTDRTFTLDVSNSSYTGGAHGLYGSLAYNYDKYTGATLKLDDIFIPSYKESLRAIAEQEYRRQNGIMPLESLTQHDWFENKFILPASIGLGSDGLHLEYVPYEIKAYAFGTTSLVVPYHLLGSIIKANSYLTPLAGNRVQQPERGSVNKTFSEEQQAMMNIRAKVLSYNRVQIDVDVTNLTHYNNGGISLSFPQLTHRNTLISKDQRGLEKVILYPVGSRLYYAPTRKTIRSQYILIEGDTKSWYKNQTKSISLTLEVPSYIENLYINARAAFRQRRDIIAIPYHGVDGQQGFGNYRIQIPMK